MNTKKIAGLAVVIIFLALIRTIAEPLRLQYYSTTSLMFEQIKPFLIAALFIAVSLFIIVALFFYERYKAVIAVAVLTIVAMVIMKIFML